MCSRLAILKLCFDVFVRRPGILVEVCRDFCQILQEIPGLLPQIRSLLLPSTAFPVHNYIYPTILRFFYIKFFRLCTFPVTVH
jgi:hypothetical protein